MALEFEKLTDKVMDMAAAAAERQQARTGVLDEVMAVFAQYAAAWEVVEARIAEAVQLTLLAQPPQPFQAARPFDRLRPLNSPIFPKPPIDRATLIAIDGSQIVPDRHGAFVYHLINIGHMVYFHGSDTAPYAVADPELFFPQADDVDLEFIDETLVTIKRDTAEIARLAELTQEHKAADQPLLAILDQRLLYAPVGNIKQAVHDRAMFDWQTSMDDVRAFGGWLVGFIDRPAKRPVLRMLHTLRAMAGERPTFSPERSRDLEDWEALDDVHLFDALLRKGERSALFIDVSQRNLQFASRQALNEMCFFYLKTGGRGREIARVDLPLWVAQTEGAADAIHSLIYDQCQLLGNYPYVLARADEMAVVRRQDQEELEFRMSRQMDKHGLDSNRTGKQQSKDIIRGNSRTSHMSW